MSVRTLAIAIYCISFLQENFYHLIENDVSASISEDAVAPSPAVPHALESGFSLQSLPEATNQTLNHSTASNGQLRESTAPNDLVGCNVDEVQTVPLYAVPDKVRSKVWLCMLIYSAMYLHHFFSHT